MIKNGTVPKDARRLVEPDAVHALNEPDRYIVKSDRMLDELASEPRPTPYWDPSVRRDPRRMRRLVSVLADANLLGFRRKAKAFVGLFFIHKKDGNQRMVVDYARVANMCHREPPRSDLAMPSALASLDLSDEWLSANGCEEEPPLDPAAIEVCGASVDLTDGFNQFWVPSVADWFCLDYQVRAGDFGVTSTWCPTAGGQVEVGPDEMLFPAFEALPMGWSWALWMCHGAVASAMRRAL